MSDRDAVLFSNEAFYRAFADGDGDAMAELWSKRHPVCCIHPGWEALHGRESVLGSWRRILSAGAPAIRCVDPKPCLSGESGFVVCYEVIGDEHLVATNIFVREDRLWRIVHHQAGPTCGRPQETPGPATPIN